MNATEKTHVTFRLTRDQAIALARNLMHDAKEATKHAEIMLCGDAGGDVVSILVEDGETNETANVAAMSVEVGTW